MRNPIHRLSPKLWYRLRPSVYRGLDMLGVFDRQYTPCLILTRSRSGSTLLTRALRSHPHLITRGEVLRAYNPLLEHVHGDPIKSVRRVYIPYPRHIQAVGFKLFYTHNNKGQEAWTWLRDHCPTLKIIHLIRENRLRVRVSYLISQETQQWVKTTQHAGESHPPMRVHVDISEWQKRMQYVDAMREEALSFFDGHDVLRVTYTDLINNWDETTRHIQTFLDVTPQPLKRSTRKQNPYPLSELITNYGEVRAALRGTEWEWMLEESNVSFA